MEQSESFLPTSIVINDFHNERNKDRIQIIDQLIRSPNEKNSIEKLEITMAINNDDNDDDREDRVFGDRDEDKAIMFEQQQTSLDFNSSCVVANGNVDIESKHFTNSSEKPIDAQMPNNLNAINVISADNKMDDIPLSANNGNDVFFHHQLVRQQTSLNTSSSTTNGTTATVKKSPKKIKGPTYQKPPDGGWGWMVVLASFIINLIADGVSLSFGVIYVELVDYFNESKSKTAWVGSLFLSIPLITGPIASALVDHFGCRKVTIAGSLLAAFGFFFGYFSTCVEHLFIAFSLSGFGLALCYVTSVVSVAYWFDKRLSLATGLSVCGTGFGTFLFAPFIIFLLREYKWRGTLLILSAVFLNMVCCGMLIRDRNIDNNAVSTSSSSNSENTFDLESNLSSVDETDDIESEDDRHITLPIGSEERHRLLKTRPRPISECQTTEEPFPKHTASLINIPTFIKNNEDDRMNNNRNGLISNTIFDELTFRRGGYLHNLICYYPHLLSMFLPCDMQCDDLTVKTKIKMQSKLPLNSVSPPPPKNSRKVVEFSSTHTESKLNGNVSGVTTMPKQQEGHMKSLIRNNSTASRFGQLLNFARQSTNTQRQQQQVNDHLINQHPYGNRLHNLRLPRGSLTYRSAMLVINKYRLKASSAPDIYRTSMVTINEEKSSSFWRNLKGILLDMVDVSNFKSLRYAIFCLSNFLLYACIDVPYVYIPDQVITSGISDKEGASKYISIIGVFNTFGVVLVGYIGDKPRLDASFIYATLIIISGLSMATIPLTTNNFVLVIQSAIYGFSISANYSLVSVILIELISLDSFTTAYGMLLLVQGFGSLIGPPLAGWLFDVSGNYDNAFYITGIAILLSGLLMIPVGRKKNCFLWKTSSEEITSVLGSSDAGLSSPSTKAKDLRSNSTPSNIKANKQNSETHQKADD